MKERAERLLRTVFLAGAITDAVALLPMLSTRIASVLWGFHDASGMYRFAMGYGASLMLGWTVLLVWAYQRPIERHAVAAFTVVVIAGLVVAELCAVNAGVLAASRMAPTWTLQAVLVVLFSAAFASGRAASVAA